MVWQACLFSRPFMPVHECRMSADRTLLVDGLSVPKIAPVIGSEGSQGQGAVPWGMGLQNPCCRRRPYEHSVQYITDAVLITLSEATQVKSVTAIRSMPTVSLAETFSSYGFRVLSARSSWSSLLQCCQHWLCSLSSRFITCQCPQVCWCKESWCAIQVHVSLLQVQLADGARMSCQHPAAH